MFSRHSINRPTSVHSAPTALWRPWALLRPASCSLMPPAGVSEAWHEKTRGPLISHCYTLNTSICFVVYNSFDIITYDMFAMQSGFYWISGCFFFPLLQLSYFLCFCPQLPSSVRVPTDQQPAVNHQSAWSTGCWVSWLTVAAQSSSRLKRESAI